MFAIKEIALRKTAFASLGIVLLLAGVPSIAQTASPAPLQTLEPDPVDNPGLPDPGPIQPEPVGLRTGMTWTVLGQQNGYVHVGYDAQTDPYYGDTAVDQFLPILCLLVDDRPAPGGITFDYYSGWARGAVQATAAVRGGDLTSQQQGDAFCASTFGTGWRMAEFHDGHHGWNFSATGGWTFWAAGQLTPGTRFWVAIDDQPANPWNSAGELPLSTPTSTEDLAVKTRLQELMSPLLVLVQNPQFRNLVLQGVAQRFDGDDNVLLSDVLFQAQQAQIVDTSSPAWQALTAKVAQFQNVNGKSYLPQIYIPNYEDGVISGSNVTMVTLETDLSRTQLPAYQLGSSGELALLPQPVDEAYAEIYEIWVLSVNEQVEVGSSSLASVQELDAKEMTLARPQDGMPLDYATGEDITCNPTGLRNDMGWEYLQKFKIPNPSSVEHWTAGKLEPRVIIVGKGGAEIKNAYFGKIKRKNVKNWYYTNLFLTTWDRALWGDYLAFKWVEEDNGPKVELSLKLPSWMTSLLGVSGDVKATFESRHDDMGSQLVQFPESTYLEYGTGTVNWTMCSMGGQGHTGNNNLALAAIASASSTFLGYSPARVNDGSRSTELGGASSWSNAGYTNGSLPQWVQLDFGVLKTFSTVVLYTTASYPIRGYRIEYFDSFWGWIPLVIVNDNTAATRTHPLGGSFTARLIRIMATSGPLHQPGFARINEFEVY